MKICVKGEFEREIVERREVGVGSMFREGGYKLWGSETIYKNWMCKEN